jgi:hypothetical protein
MLPAAARLQEGAVAPRGKRACGPSRAGLCAAPVLGGSQAERLELAGSPGRPGAVRAQDLEPQEAAPSSPWRAAPSAAAGGPVWQPRRAPPRGPHDPLGAAPGSVGPPGAFRARALEPRAPAWASPAPGQDRLRSAERARAGFAAPFPTPLPPNGRRGGRVEGH